MNFNNLQNFTINATTYIQDISQTTHVHSRTLIRSGFAFFESAETFHYPLKLNLDLTFFPDGTVTQLGVASQEFNHHVITPFFASSLATRWSLPTSWT